MCGRTACTLNPDQLCRVCGQQASAAANASPQSSSKGRGKKRGGGKESSTHDDDVPEETTEWIPAQWRDDPQGHRFHASYNLCPTNYCPVLVSGSHFPNDYEADERVLQPMRWGLIPAWYRGDPSKFQYKMVNCRAETLNEKASYRNALNNGRRCVMVVDGFYEWSQEKGKRAKQPYFLHMPQPSNLNVKFYQPDAVVEEEEEDGDDDSCSVAADEWNGRRMMFIAGLFDIAAGSNSPKKSASDRHGSASPKKSSERQGSTSPKKSSGRRAAADGDDAADSDSADEGPLFSFAVITVESSKDISWMHHRMPVVLWTPEDVNAWLDSELTDSKDALKLLVAKEGLRYYPVSTHLNNVRNKDAECLRPIKVKEEDDDDADDVVDEKPEADFRDRKKPSKKSGVATSSPRSQKTLTSYFGAASTSASSGGSPIKKERKKT